MRRAALALLAAACGCNGLLGLTEVEAERDIDRDGIPSGDNCPSVYNPLQEDEDGDGVGDVCDACPLPALPSQIEADDPEKRPIDADHDGQNDGCDLCLKGPQIDEDGDTVHDACDVCPHVADASQSDADGDGVGDACDGGLLMSQQQAVFYDGFAPADPRWTTSGAGMWTNTSSAMEVSATPVGGAAALRSPQLDVSGPYWAIDTQIELTSLTPGRVGIQLDASGSGRFITCGVVCGPMGANPFACAREIVADNLPTASLTPFVPTGPIRIRVEHQTTGQDRLACRIQSGVTDDVGYQPRGDEEQGFSLFTTIPSRFTHVFVQN